MFQTNHSSSITDLYPVISSVNKVIINLSKSLLSIKFALKSFSISFSQVHTLAWILPSLLTCLFRKILSSIMASTYPDLRWDYPSILMILHYAYPLCTILYFALAIITSIFTSQTNSQNIRRRVVIVWLMIAMLGTYVSIRT